MPPGSIGTKADVGLTVTARGATPTTAEVTLTYASDADDEAQARDREVDREVARVYAALARAEAVEANRLGEFTRAVGTLHRARSQIAGFAGSDPQIGRVMSELTAEAPAFGGLMAAPTRKAHLFAAENAAKSRDAAGRAQRAGRPNPPEPPNKP
jgi:hypothetical protein